MAKIATDYIMNNKWQASTRKQIKAILQSDEAGRVAEGYAIKHQNHFNKNGLIVIEPFYCLIKTEGK